MQSSEVIFRADGMETPMGAEELAKEFPMAKFQPVLPTLDMTGMAAAPAMGTAVAFTNGAIALESAPFGAGSYFFGVRAWDIWGNVAPQTSLVSFHLSGPLM